MHDLEAKFHQARLAALRRILTTGRHNHRLLLALVTAESRQVEVDDDHRAQAGAHPQAWAGQVVCKHPSGNVPHAG